MKLNMTKSELNRFAESNKLEVYTNEQFGQFVENNKDLLVKSDRAELDEAEQREYDTLFAEIRSFTPVTIYDNDPNSKIRIVKSVMYVRPQQVEWDDIEKSEDGEEDLSKARAGVYTDTGLNRKLGRVGQKYGSKKQSADEDDGEGKSSKDGKKWDNDRNPMTILANIKSGTYSKNTDEYSALNHYKEKDPHKITSLGIPVSYNNKSDEWFVGNKNKESGKSDSGVKREYTFQYKNRFGEIQQKSFIASNEEQAMKMAKEGIVGTDIQPSKVPDKTGREEKN